MKDYGVYLLLKLEKQPAVKNFIKTFNDRTKTDLNLAKIWKQTYCEIVKTDEKHFEVLIRLEPFMRFVRHGVPLLISRAAKLGLEKEGYTGKFESCNDRIIIRDYAEKYILNK